MVAVDKNITEDIVGDVGNDWRLTLFGESILLNSTVDESKIAKDDENPEGNDCVYTVTQSMPTQAFFQGCDYIALFFGANYCPHFKKFAPLVVAAKELLQAKNCRTIFVSNDRDQASFDQSCLKVRGLDVMPYDTSKTQAMGKLFGLETIPALMILANKNFSQETPQVYSNARQILESDHHCKNFPWGRIQKSFNSPVTALERLWIHGRHGNWWQVGHKNVSPINPDDMYIDEHAARARAGLLNIVATVALMNVFFIKDPNIVLYGIYPLVAWEMITSVVFGFTPFAPIGFLGTVLAIIFHPKPLWKPAAPKRFAWMIGFCVATTYFVLVAYRKELGAAYVPSVAGVVLMCSIATWLEGNCGFCLGCFIYNQLVLRYFHKEKCQECKISESDDHSATSNNEEEVHHF